MLASLLIGFREGLEAALIVGIVMGYLAKTGRRSQLRVAWAGVGVAVLTSFLVALSLTVVGAELQGRAEQVFEGTTMFLAVTLLTWMIFWMRTRGRKLQTALETDLRATATSGAMWGLFGLTFVAVFREGVETALLFTASAFVTNSMSTLIGAGIGLALAAALGWAIYASAVRLNLGRFFNLTGVLLLFFAAGLLARGVHEFQEAAILPITIEHVWNLNPILSDSSVLGQTLNTLFGYTGSPSLLEVLSYASYWIVALGAVRWLVQKGAAPRASQPLSH
jgi:high-affinity iron transporter